MNEHDQKLADVLLDSLLSGRQVTEDIREACIRALSEVLDISIEEIVALVDERIQRKEQHVKEQSLSHRKRCLRRCENHVRSPEW